MNVYINGQGHMTKMVAMAKIQCSKNVKKIFFFRTRRPIILKLGVKHLGIELYKVYINLDPGMTLTNLTQGQLRSPMHWNGKKRKM